MHASLFASIETLLKKCQAMHFQPIKIKMLPKQLRLALRSEIGLTEQLIIAIPNNTNVTEHLVYLPAQREGIKTFLLTKKRMKEIWRQASKCKGPQCTLKVWYSESLQDIFINLCHTVTVEWVIWGHQQASGRFVLIKDSFDTDILYFIYIYIFGEAYRHAN